MKAKQYWIGVLFALCGLHQAQAGEDRSFDPYMRPAIDEVKEVLVTAGKCTDMNDCSKKNIVFFSPKSKGVDLTVYGITEPAIVQELLSAMAKRYYTLPEGSSLRIRFIAHPHDADMKRSVFKAPPVFAELNFGGNKN